MRKAEEMANPNSCWNRARPDEMIFVLLGRDIASPHAIYEWIKERIRRNKNKDSDKQLLEAEKCAEIMQAELAATIRTQIQTTWPYETTVDEVCEIVKAIMQVDTVTVEIEQYTSGRYEAFFWINGKESPDAIRWNPTFELPIDEYVPGGRKFEQAVARATGDLCSLLGFICDHVQSMTVPAAIRARDLGALYALANEIVLSNKIKAGKRG